MKRLIVIGVLILVALRVLRVQRQLAQKRRDVLHTFAELEAALHRRHGLARKWLEVVGSQAEREPLEMLATARQEAVSGLLLLAADPTEAESLGEQAACERKFGIAMAAAGRALADRVDFDPAEQFETDARRLAVNIHLFDEAVSRYNQALTGIPRLDRAPARLHPRAPLRI